MSTYTLSRPVPFRSVGSRNAYPYVSECPLQNKYANAALQ